MNKREPWLLLAPGLILYAVFGLGPILLSAVSSMWEMGAYGRGWIGLEAWRSVLTNRIFWQSVGNTLKFTAVVLPITLGLSVIVSVVLSWAPRKVQSFGRAAFYIPAVTSAVMISIIWRWVLAPNGLLNKITGTQALFLGSNPWAFWSISTMVISITLGAPIVYLMASFATIDTSLYEAAKLDGCNRWQEARFITIPGILPVMVFLSVERLAGTIQLWQFPYSVTGGGPNYGTSTVVLLTYQEAFVHTRLAHAAVMSLFLLVTVCGLMIGLRLLSGQRILG